MKQQLAAVFVLILSSTAFAGFATTPEKCETSDGAYSLTREENGARLLRNTKPYGETSVYAGPEKTFEVDDSVETYTISADSVAKEIENGVAYFGKDKGELILSIQEVKGSLKTKDFKTSYQLIVRGQGPVTKALMKNPLVLNCSYFEKLNP